MKGMKEEKRREGKRREDKSCRWWEVRGPELTEEEVSLARGAPGPVLHEPQEPLVACLVSAFRCVSTEPEGC